MEPLRKDQWGLGTVIEYSKLRDHVCGSEAESVVAVATTVSNCIEQGGTLFVLSDGASKGIAANVAAQLCRRHLLDGGRLPVVSLCVSTWGMPENDEDCVRPVAVIGRIGDVLLALVTQSHECALRCVLAEARRRGIQSVVITGPGVQCAQEVAELAVVIPTRTHDHWRDCVLLIATAPCTQDSNARAAIRASDAEARRKVVPWDRVLRAREVLRRAGKRVVWTNGCFDLVHVGHVRFLQEAKKCGDALIVGVNSDESVQRLKGRGRPIVCAEERMEVLAALESVTYVVMMEQDAPTGMLAELRPDVHCKGREYGPGGKPLPEADVVRSWGGRIELIPMVPGQSTTALIGRVGGAGT